MDGLASALDKLASLRGLRRSFLLKEGRGCVVRFLGAILAQLGGSIQKERVSPWTYAGYVKGGGQYWIRSTRFSQPLAKQGDAHLTRSLATRSDYRPSLKTTDDYRLFPGTFGSIWLDLRRFGGRQGLCLSPLVALPFVSARLPALFALNAQARPWRCPPVRLHSPRSPDPGGEGGAPRPGVREQRQGFLAVLLSHYYLEAG